MMRKPFRMLRLAALDALDFFARRRSPMTPSRVEIERIGGFDFHEVGRNLVRIAIELGDLKPDQRILDIGCGVGRLAVPLTSYLTTGEYAGFDIDRRAIQWCRRFISSVHPNFWFAHADVVNDYYNPHGKVAASDFRFPCATASIDLAFASSLFTHLLPGAVDHYVSEIARVLKPGGRAIVSFFLLDDSVRLADPLVQPSFTHFPEEYYAVADAMSPESAIAYDVNVVSNAFTSRGLEVERIERGSWRALVNPLTYQDLVIVKKRPETATPPAIPPPCR